MGLRIPCATHCSLHLLRFRFVFPLLALLSFALHAHIFQRDLVGIHVWRQTETATVVRTLARGDGDLLHPKVLDLKRRDRVFRMELPLMQAAFAAVCNAVPAKDYSVMRVLTFVIGLLTIAGMYALGRTVSGQKAVGTLAAWMFSWSPVFYYYTLNPMPDNAALCAGVWSLAFLMMHQRRPAPGKLAGAALCLGLAAAMKLPYVVFGLAALPLWWRALRAASPHQQDVWQIPTTYGLALAPAALWYASVIPDWRGNDVPKGILGASTSAMEIFSILSGHVISTGPELLINYGSLAAALAGLILGIRKGWWKRAEFAPMVAAAIGVLLYYVYELPLIGLVHDYYLMPFLPLIFLIAAAGACWMLRQQNIFLRGLAVLGLIAIPFTAFLRIDPRWQTREPGFNATYLREKKELQSLIPPTTRVIVGPDDSRRIFLYHLNRIGWTFSDADLSTDSIRQWTREGARFILTDPQTMVRLHEIAGNQQPVFSTENLVVHALH